MSSITVIDHSNFHHIYFDGNIRIYCVSYKYKHIELEKKVYLEFMKQYAYEHKKSKINFIIEMFAASSILRNDKEWNITFNKNGILSFNSPSFIQFKADDYINNKFNSSKTTNMCKYELYHKSGKNKITSVSKEPNDLFYLYAGKEKFNISLKKIRKLKDCPEEDHISYLEKRIENGLFIELDFIQNYRDTRFFLIFTYQQ